MVLCSLLQNRWFCPTLKSAVLSQFKIGCFVPLPLPPILKSFFTRYQNFASMRRMDFEEWVSTKTCKSWPLRAKNLSWEEENMFHGRVSNNFICETSDPFLKIKISLNIQLNLQNVYLEFQEIHCPFSKVILAPYFWRNGQYPVLFRIMATWIIYRAFLKTDFLKEWWLDCISRVHLRKRARYWLAVHFLLVENWLSSRKKKKTIQQIKSCP